MGIISGPEDFREFCEEFKLSYKSDDLKGVYCMIFWCRTGVVELFRVYTLKEVLRADWARSKLRLYNPKNTRILERLNQLCYEGNNKVPQKNSRF